MLDMPRPLSRENTALLAVMTFRMDEGIADTFVSIGIQADRANAHA